MALSPEKLGNNHQSESFTSESATHTSTTAPQLEALLDLLWELNIAQSGNSSDSELSLLPQAEKNTEAILENLQNLILESGSEVSDFVSASLDQNSSEPSLEASVAAVDNQDLETTNELVEPLLVPSQNPEMEEKFPIVKAETNTLETKDNLLQTFPPLPQNQAEIKENNSDSEKFSNSLAVLQSLLIQSNTEQAYSESLPLSLPTVEIVDHHSQQPQQLNETELSQLHYLIATLQQKLELIEHQVYEPTDLINPLLPLITELLNLKVTESREGIFNYIVPIIDEIIQRRIQQDKLAISTVLGTILPTAISQQISDSPDEIAKAIAPEIGAAIQEQIRLERDSISQALAPEMGKAIKAQIELERDAMVDALYPVIGDTISKYMAEAIRSINKQVETSLSPEGIQRKIRAKIQGVSEAELILQEAMPSSVQAIFLIQKNSGLVIAQAQQSEAQELDADMLAGMLTAIRSFANECIAQSGNISELNEIDYGNSKLILEVAGYCYLAVVIQGEPSTQLIRKLRKTFATIIQNYGQSIEAFEGDPETVPATVQQLLEGLTATPSTTKEKPANSPPILVKLGIGLLLIIGVPWGIYQYQNGVDHQIEVETASALYSAPELSVYRLTPKVHRGTLTLTGRVPNQYLRSKAAQITQIVAPTQKLRNAIITVDVPPDPELTAGEVKRVQSVLNQKEGVAISANYQAGKVNVEGTVAEVADAKKITQAFEQVPGVRSVVSTIQLQPQLFTTRIYFEAGSTQLEFKDINQIMAIQRFLNQYPETHLKIIGHSDNVGNVLSNQQLALKRAIAIKDVLQAQGIAPWRLHVSGTTNLPPGVNPDQPLDLSRCVRFELFNPLEHTQ